ncbi:MAG TPA: VWA-like domain-containing protein [Burkholderiales bacterium]|nr:VWA-like domain-containing protein [Burkholderiales bacterium]
MGRGRERPHRDGARGGLALARIATARARLVLERPFLGELALHLEPQARAGEVRLGTDGRRVFFDPETALAAPLAELQFALAHQALHLALGHFARRRHRLARLWELACDYAVNQLLVDDGMTPPPHALLDPAFRGLAAEEIYPLLAADARGATLDRHAPGASSAALHSRARARRAPDAVQPEEGFLEAHREGLDELAARAAPLEAEGIDERWSQRLAASALTASRAGRLNPHWQRALGELARPRLPWRALLARFLTSIAPEDYGYERPGRRQESAGGAIFPGRIGRLAHLVVALDTSGSIGRGELEEFLDELDALHGQLRARVVLTACDAELAPHAPWTFEPWERIALPEHVGGGGGTRFTPVFDWVRDAAWRPDALLYFTDALGEFPELAPQYPVLWIVKGRGEVPWGERVQLN